MKSKDRYFFGSFLVALGILLALGQFDFWHIIYSAIRDFWPLLIVVGGIHRISRNSTLSGVFLSCIGVFLLCHTLFGLNLDGFFWPLIFIATGVAILCDIDKKSTKEQKEVEDEEDRVEDTRILWNTNKKITSKNFKGGSIDNVLGRYIIDLSKCTISDSSAKLEVNAVLGAVDVIVPKNCRVIVNGDSIFGTWDTNLSERDIEKPVLKLTGTAIFGGVKVTE